jgi:DNA-binding response OmpR family regulator
MKPIRVLLVEDNPGDADLTRETLETGRLHLEIAVVTDGAEAVAYLLRRPPFASVEVPDLVMLDLNLPKLDGRQVLAEMRRHDDLKRVPVVVLTSSDAERDVVESYKLGANCYVTKPVDLEAFQSIVRSVEGFWFTVVKLP